MKKYIFLAHSGGSLIENEAECELVEKVTAVGMAFGNGSADAFAKLLADNDWIYNSGYDKLFCFELAEDGFGRRGVFSIEEAKKRMDPGYMKNCEEGD